MPQPLQQPVSSSSGDLGTVTVLGANDVEIAQVRVSSSSVQDNVVVSEPDPTELLRATNLEVVSKALDITLRDMVRPWDVLDLVMSIHPHLLCYSSRL